MKPKHYGLVYRTGKEDNSRKYFFPPSQFTMAYINLLTLAQIKHLFDRDFENKKEQQDYLDEIRKGAKKRYNTYNLIDKRGGSIENTRIGRSKLTTKIKTRSRGSFHDIHVRHPYLQENKPDSRIILSCDCKDHNFKVNDYEIACMHLNAGLILAKADGNNVFTPYSKENLADGIKYTLEKYFLEKRGLYEIDVGLTDILELDNTVKTNMFKDWPGKYTFEVLENPNEDFTLNRKASVLNKYMVENLGLKKQSTVREWKGELCYSYTNDLENPVNVRLMFERNPPEILVSVLEPLNDETLYLLTKDVNRPAYPGHKTAKDPLTNRKRSFSFFNKPDKTIEQILQANR